jgi:hypothetical protein
MEYRSAARNTPRQGPACSRLVPALDELESSVSTTDPVAADVTTRIEHLCEVMHNAYEKAAIGAGWETQAASRKPWASVPEANKQTMRAAVTALLAEVLPARPLEGSAVAESVPAT